MSSPKSLVLAFAAAALAAPAPVPQSGSAVAAYGQCGGQGWTGGTTCVSGYTCKVSNPYYSQCLPGSAGSTTTTTVKATTTTTKASTTTTTSKAVSTPTTTKASTTTAAGSTTTKPPTGTTTTAGSASNSGNPFAGKSIYANPYYASEIETLAIPSLPASLVPAASAVANTGTFVWLDTAAKVPTMDTYLTNIEGLNAAGGNVMGAFVVYDLPDRDCAALASNGEYSVTNNGLANYEAYIDSIAAIIKKHSTTEIALVIEPDSLGNLVTNLNVAKCQEAEADYKAGITYAMKTLNFPNVAMYLDAGHAGWLGWSANVGPAATLFGQLYSAAGMPAAVRGLATNVANYNSFSIATAPSYTQGSQIYDEQLYIHEIAPLLVQAGYPAHFIVDTGRDGVQPTQQQAWGDWCNVKGTGFGVQPTTNTGDALVDAFVWVKPLGESDGTSNSSATRYDAHCGYADALQPAPEAGTWFQAYFQQGLANANPKLA